MADPAAQSPFVSSSSSSARPEPAGPACRGAGAVSCVDPLVSSSQPVSLFAASPAVSGAAQGSAPPKPSSWEAFVPLSSSSSSSGGAAGGGGSPQGLPRVPLRAGAGARVRGGAGRAGGAQPDPRGPRLRLPSQAPPRHQYPQHPQYDQYDQYERDQSPDDAGGGFQMRAGDAQLHQRDAQLGLGGTGPRGPPPRRRDPPPRREPPPRRREPPPRRWDPPPRRRRPPPRRRRQLRRLRRHRYRRRRRRGPPPPQKSSSSPPPPRVVAPPLAAEICPPPPEIAAPGGPKIAAPRPPEAEPERLRGVTEEPPPRPPPARLLLPPLAARDLVLWRDARRSGALFGGSLALLLALAACSAVSVAAHAALALLCGTLGYRVYRAVLAALRKADEGHPFRAYLELDVALSPEAFQSHAAAAMVHVNRALRLLLRLFLVEDLVDSLKLAVAMWLLTYVGAVFNGITLLILADLLAFTVPPVYEKYKAQIDHYVNMAREQTRSLVAKVQAKVPGMAKKKPE